MPDPVNPTAAATAEALRPMLAQQLGRLRRRYLVHGLGLVLAAVAGAVLLFFALDRWLGLPVPVRLFHTGVVGALLFAGGLRFVRYPLTRRFADTDLAVWFERAFPELHQRLVSAVQLQHELGGDLRNQSRAMIERLLAETTSTVQRLPLERLFVARPTQRVVAAAALLAAVLVGGAVWSPATARAFLLRHIGVAASYPRATTLRIELPPAGPDLQRTDSGDTIELVLPAGADLHVSVLAEGVVPKEVFLDLRPLRGGDQEPRAIAMAPRPGDRFRHVFRRLSGSFAFHARGGDDDQGDRVVVVRTVFPPQVATLRATVQPPAYTGAGAAEQHGGAIEALVGSEVDLLLTTTTAVRSATMVFLESGRRLELVPLPPRDDGGEPAAHRGRFVVDASDRYQIELIGDNGLRNPNPGTYPIAALQDYAPVGRWLLPEDEGLLLLPTALLCLRLDLRDDFGLAAVDLAIERGGTRAPARAMLPPTPPYVTTALLTELLEVRELLATEDAGQEGIVLQVALRDNRAPAAGVTELPRRIVQVADPAQLAGAIARLFRGLREETAQALDVQRDRRGRLEDLLQRPAPAAIELQQTLTGIEVGQGRVAGSVERVHRGLMRAFDLHLWNRLEPSQNAAQVVELYRQHARALAEPLAFDPAFYRDVRNRRAAGTLGALEQALDPILAMLGLVDGIGQGDAPAAARALAEAQVARDGSSRTELLQRAFVAQQRIEASLQQLLLRLEEWNDYQDLVQEVRALRDRQRDLQNRTDEVRGKR